MMTLGITGRSGCGKSTVTAVFAARGIPLADADQLSREILLPGSPLLPQLAERFGADIIKEDGTLDRRLLADRAFATPEGKAALDALTHPEIVHRIRAAKQAAQQAGAKTETPAVNEAEVVAIAVAQGRDPVAALKAAHDKADGDKAKAAGAKPPENGPLGKLPDPVYVPLKAKALEVMLADQLSWITAWRTERFASPQYAGKYYQRKPFYQQALNESSGALPSAAAPAESEEPREVPFIDKDRLDRAAWGYDFAHTGIVALLGQVLLDVIPTTQTNQLGGPLVAAQESEYIQIKKSGDARRAALMGSPTMLDFYDNYVHDTLAKYNHDPLHSSFSHGYFASRTIYDNDDDTWDSVKQFGQRVKAIIDINVGDILVQARTDMKDLNTVSGVLGKIYRDIKSEAFKILLP